MPTYNPELYRKERHWKDGEFDVYRNMQWSGPGCHDGCGLLFYMKDGKLDHVEGDPNDEFNRGRLCMRCLNMVDEAVYNPERLGHPMKRAGKRGEDKWEQITWDEAYDMIEEHVRKAWAEYGPESIVSIEGTGRNVIWQIPMMEYSAFKSPNFVGGFLAGDSCYLPRLMAAAATLGAPTVADCGQFDARRYDAPDYVYPEVIVQWGCNAIKSNGDGFLGHWLIDCMRVGGSKLINVDPRITWMASRAEYALQVRPGTDAAVAMAMLKVIIDEDLYDHDFVEKWCYGFEEMCESIEEFTPEHAAEISGVPAEDIIGAARLYGSAHPAAFHWGLATDQTPNGIGQAHAFMALQAITGNLDVPGGNIFAIGPFNVDVLYGCGYDYFIDDELKKKRIGLDKYPLHDNFGVSNVLHQMLETGEPYPIQMMYIAGNNTIANMAAQPQKVHKALNNIPFIVIAELWKTPLVMALADLVLPVAMGCERETYREWWTPARATVKIHQFEEAKSDEEILVDLSLRLNPEGVPWHDVHSMLNWVMAKDNAPMTFTELQEKQYVYDLPGYRRYETGKLRPDGQPGFMTPTGKVELKSVMFDALSYHSTPYFEEPPESPVSTPELYEQYPFVLTTGGRNWEFFHSEHRNMQTMREFHPDPRFEINPIDAENLGIKEGDWCWLENQRGRARQTARITPTVKPGVLHAEHGWWFPEKEASAPSLYGVYDSNINNLTQHDIAGETGYGSPYKCLLCKVYKCTPENSEILPTQAFFDAQDL